MNWHDWFVYDETSPSCLRNLVSRGRAKAGSTAGTQRSDGYWVVGFQRSNVLCHRIVYEMFNGPIPDRFEVDHKDGTPANCKKDNLRAIPKPVNQRNMRLDSRNTSGTAGVSLVTVAGRNKTHTYWAACWVSSEGRQCRKYFSVDRLGDSKARALANVTRLSEIHKLNGQGLGYTERHGTCSTQN